MVRLIFVVALLLSFSSGAMFDDATLKSLVGENFTGKLIYASVIESARVKAKDSKEILRGFQKKELRRLRSFEATDDFSNVDDIPQSFSTMLMANFLSAAASAVDTTLFRLLNPEASIFTARKKMIKELRRSLLDFTSLPTVMKNSCTSSACINQLRQYSLGVVTFAAMLGRYEFADVDADLRFVKYFLTRAVIQLKDSNDYYHKLAALYLQQFLYVVEQKITPAQFWLALNVDVQKDKIPLNPSEIHSSAHWLNDLGNAAEIALPHASIKVPERMEFAKTIILTKCFLQGGSVIAGYFHGECTDQIGTVYDVNIYSFGASAGLRVVDSEIVIKHHQISHPEGTWTGGIAEFVFGYSYFKSSKKKSRIEQKTMTPGLNVNFDVARITIRRK